MPAQPIFLSMPAIQQCQACSLMLSFLDSIFFDLNFHAHFLLSFCLTDLILVFEILIKSTIANDYSALCCALLEKSFICSVSHCVLSPCLRFQPSLLLQAGIQSCAAFLEKIFCLHPHISNSGAKISLAFVYNA